MKTKKKSWTQYLWIASAIYLILGAFNILFAWLGLLCFMIPLLIAVFGGEKKYCNTYCGRGQLLDLLGRKLKLSRQKPMPKWLKHKYFRYGFLVFFMAMFVNMLVYTYTVFSGINNLQEVITLLWTFKLPWQWASVGGVAPWVSQFAFGFYSMMMTSTLLGIVTMALYKPRSWCVYCPMGTMTQGVCQLRAKAKQKG